MEAEKQSNYPPLKTMIIAIRSKNNLSNSISKYQKSKYNKQKVKFQDVQRKEWTNMSKHEKKTNNNKHWWYI